MSDDTRPDQDPISDDSVPTRRRVLALGAVGAGAVVSIRPALAQTVGSVMNCEIPIPDPSRAGGYISATGQVVPARTKLAFPPASRPFKALEIKRAMVNGSTLPGVEPLRSRAYIQYIRRLQRGQSGFTCFASLQMPRG